MIGRKLMLFFSLGLTFLNTGVGQVVSIGESHRIQSNQVNEDREYKVHLPDRYKWAPDGHYPFSTSSTATLIFSTTLLRSSF